MTVHVPSFPTLLPEPPVELEAWQRNGVLRICLLGDLDRASAPSVSNGLAVTCLDGWRAVLVDAAAISSIDEAGLRVFVDADTRVEATGGLMAIARCTRVVRRMFSASGCEGLLGRERIAIAIAYSEDGREPEWSPFAPGLASARSA
jgi:anti-anti-sigma factor